MRLQSPPAKSKFLADKRLRHLVVGRWAGTEAHGKITRSQYQRIGNHRITRKRGDLIGETIEMKTPARTENTRVDSGLDLKLSGLRSILVIRVVSVQVIAGFQDNPWTIFRKSPKGNHHLITIGESEIDVSARPFRIPSPDIKTQVISLTNCQPRERIGLN